MSEKRLVAFAAVIVAILPFAQISPASAAGSIKITRIHYAQKGTDLDTEYIVFKNTSGSTIQMKGWKVVSKPSSDNQHYFFPRTSVAPGASVTLYTGHGTNTSGKRYWNANGPRWDNDGDKAVLKNARPTVVDTCQYAGGGTTAYC
jgi:hypothetical protein